MGCFQAKLKNVKETVKIPELPFRIFYREDTALNRPKEGYHWEGCERHKAYSRRGSHRFSVDGSDRMNNGYEGMAELKEEEGVKVEELKAKLEVTFDVSVVG